MGGMGFIENNKALCMLSVLISTHMLEAARQAGRAALLLLVVGLRLRRRQAGVTRGRAAARGRRLPGHARGRLRLGEALQRAHGPPLLRGLRPRDPRRPLPQRLRAPRAPTTAVARRRRPPSAARWPRPCSSGTNEIEIWGDGQQTRSFTYIDDCVEGTLRLTASDVREPLNIGSEQLVTINELVDIVEGIAGVTLKRNYNLVGAPGRAGPQQRQHADPAERWAGRRPSALEDGLQNTYKWIFDQMS